VEESVECVERVCFRSVLSVCAGSGRSVLSVLSVLCEWDEWLECVG
jgi:hypothetical protein